MTADNSLEKDLFSKKIKSLRYSVNNNSNNQNRGSSYFPNSNLKSNNHSHSGFDNSQEMVREILTGRITNIY